MSRRNRFFWLLLILCPAGAIAQQAATPPAPVDELQREAQAVKSEVLDLEAEFTALVHDIRYPPANRWTVFVTAEPIPDFELDTVELLVDGVTVASHEYDDAQRAALAEGGAHRLHMGNLGTGSHLVSTRLTGRYAGETYSRTGSVEIDKPEGPRLLELRLQALPESAEDGRGPGFAHQSHADRR